MISAGAGLDTITIEIGAAHQMTLGMCVRPRLICDTMASLDAGQR
jgi:hypothetical protein